ncbi:MAG: choice-of-anchor Q domain-containing protein, partial [Acidobacteriaceae bacterium]
MNRSILRGAAVLCLLFCAVATQAQQSSNTATFMYFDNVTKNNWQLAYGIDGYSLSIPNESYLPNGISLSVVNSMFWNWATPDVSSRGLLNPANNVSSATTWYDSTQFSILVDIPGGKVEQFTLYALDWDSQGRSETVQAVDADTNTPLASQTVSNFSNGVYLVWDISGHVRFNITRMAGPNAVISGVFVGGNDNAIHVPADLPTIQSAIDAASPGGTIVVAPGTYQENINFEGKAVTLTSSGGPSVTTIDGGGNATVVTFANGEGPSSVLNGFTVQNGLGSLATAGGIQIANASPTITGNVITKNRAPAALGIYVDGGSPLIENNIITQNNSQVGDAEGGGGILVDAGGASPANPQIIGNTITNNSVALGGIGGGIAVEYFSRAVIQGNLIANNTAYNDGGGIAIQDYDGAVIVQNVIVNNTTIDGVGGGVSVSTPEGVTVIVSDNTVAMNNAAPPENISGIDIGSLAQLYTFTNNIVVAPTGQFAVFCETENGAVLPTLSYTDAYAPGGQAWGGTCNYGSQVGNISVDPLFVNLSISNFHLQPGSPAIDAGSNSAPDLPSTDFDGHSRIFNGTVDLGAYEYQGLTSVSISLPALNFPTQAVGVSSQPLTLTLTNSGSTALQINSIGTTGNFSETDNCQTSKGIAPGQFCQINVVFTPTAGGPQTGQLLVAANLAGSPLSLSLSGIGRTSSTGAAATLAGTDTATQGNWQTQYGSEGYSIAIGAQKLPTYDPSFAVQNQLNWTWAASTTDPRALRIPGGSGGTATTWYSSSSFSLDVNIGDGNSHQVALYLVDWDLGGRSETVQVVDAVSNSPLASTTVSSFTNGVYLLWSISGHVRINISPNSGPNAVVSGVFFGGPPSQAPAPPSLGITKTHSGHVSQGQQGFAYTLTVTNAAGAGTTSGTVTVTESVPSGLSLVSMAGSGWTCPTNTAYCTRNDPLSGG